MRITKQAIIPILLLCIMVFSGITAIAGSLGGINTSVTSFKILGYEKDGEDMFCFEIEDFEGTQPCLKVKDIVLDKGELSTITTDLIKARLENIVQVNLINEARTEVNKRTCVIASDCDNAILATEGDTYYCVKSKCTTQPDTSTIETALDNAIGKTK